MAKFILCTVHDSAVGAYMPPFTARSKGEAMRMYIDTVKGKDTSIAQHPEDFTLFQIGAYDDNSGYVEACPPEKIMNGVEAVALLNRE